MGLEVEVGGEQLQVAITDVLREGRVASLRVWGPGLRLAEMLIPEHTLTWLCWNRNWTLA
jgi:hypothetical protein